MIQKAELERVIQKLPPEMRQSAGPIIEALAEIVSIDRTRTQTAAVLTTHRKAPTLDETFPYPLIQDVGTCATCNKDLKEHKYTDMFVEEKHEAKATSYFDTKSKAINQAEILLEIFAKGTSEKLFSEKDRINFLRQVSREDGGEEAESWQQRFHYQSQEAKLMWEIMYGAKQPLDEVQDLYNDVRVRLKHMVIFEYKGVRTKFDERWNRYAQAQYIRVWTLAKKVESQVEGLAARLEDMDSRADEEVLRLLSTKETTKASVTTPPPAAPSPGASTGK